MLEVKILAIELPIDYGYNGCSGILPANCEPGRPARIIFLDRQRMTARVRDGHCHPPAAVLRQHGRGPGARGRPREQ